MIDIETIKGLQEWINSQKIYFQDALSWSVVRNGDGSNKVHPIIILECLSADEHEVLRGVFELSVEVRLETIPHNDGTSGTDQSQHESMSTALYEILGDTDAIEFVTSLGAVRCFDIRGSAPNINTDEDKRISTFELLVTSCKS